MAMSDQEKARVRGLARVERLQADGMAAIENGRDQDADEIADQLLQLSQQTSDPFVSRMAMSAQAGIATGEIGAAATALASVNDQIAATTKTFSTAASLAQEGQANLTFPFIAGKTASMLDLLKTLKQTITNTSAQVSGAPGVGGLETAFDQAQSAVAALEAAADKLAE